MGSYPDKYVNLNEASTKFLNVVAVFEGTNGAFSLVPTYKKIRYGDPDLFYGDPGIVYGGLKRLDDVLPYLTMQSSLTISQKIEPEQGRASGSTFSLQLLDKDGFVTRFISPGKYFPSILGGVQVKIYSGFANSSFKEDYICIFRGYVTAVSAAPTLINIQLTDGNFKRKQQCFLMGKSNLTSAIDNVVTTLPMGKTDAFIQHTLGPDGLYDSSLRTYLKVDDEFMQYTSSSVITPTSIQVTRGARGSIAIAHDLDAEVQNIIELVGNIMDLSLKIMLSGWGGPWLENISVYAFNNTEDPILGITTKTIVLLDGINAVDDYGLGVGDYIYVTGSASNNGTFTITGFGDAKGYPNKLIFVNENTILEGPPSSGVMSFRSRYDTLPELCSIGLRPIDIDVAKWQEARTLFAFQTDNIFENLIDGPISAKEHIEKEYLLPIGAYSVTRFGRISVAFTKSPIASSDLVILDSSNIVDPQNISVNWALNTRKFFNEVQYIYDVNDQGDETSIFRRLDTTSLNNTQTSSVLPIHAKGLKTTNSAEDLIDRRGGYILRRYKDAAVEISLKTTWTAASLIQVSDIVALYDNGSLKIANLKTGERDLGSQLYEVTEWSLSITTGQAQLKLLSTLDYELTDRFGVIAPSSEIDSGSSTTQIKIRDSFGARYPNQEYKKWEGIVGDRILIRSLDYTFTEEVQFVSFNAVDKYILNVTPPLSITPPAGYIVEVAPYPTNATASDQAKSKLLFSFIDNTAYVVTGISTTQFTVSAGDALKLTEGLPVLIHSSDYNTISSEATIQTIAGVTITLTTAIEFTPVAGMLIELIGFKDSGGPYRIL